MPDHHTQKLLRCGPQGEEKKARGNSTALDEVVSRDLGGVPNCQKTVKDRKAWLAVIHQT